MYRYRCLRCSILEFNTYQAPSSYIITPPSYAGRRNINCLAEQRTAIIRPRGEFPRPSKLVRPRPPLHATTMTRGGHAFRPLEMRPRYQRYRKALDKNIAKVEKAYPIEEEPELVDEDEFVDEDEPAGGDFLRGKDKTENMEKSLSLPRERRVGQEILKDRFRVAERVQALLKDEKYAAAAEYVRDKGKICDVTVSYNHLIQYKMDKGDCTKAYKVFVEMKKRGTKPDAYTYGIMLEGFAKNPTYSKGLERALSIYYSLSAPSSPITPSILHTNAILKVCLRMRDMDALWAIAEKIPSTGPRQPNNLTFTIIMNGLRFGDEGFAKAIIDGRSLWDSIVQRWREGRLVVDEELACAMGRLLMKSERPEEWDEVLTLCQNHFGIPRLLPRWGTRARRSMRLASPFHPNKKLLPDHVLHPSPEKAGALMALSELGNQEEKSPAGDEWVPDDVGSREDFGAESAHLKRMLFSETNSNDDAKSPSSMNKPSSGLRLMGSSLGDLAIPGPNTLSLLMEACANLRSPSTALEYWDFLINTHNITPDMDNFQWRMRVHAEMKDSEATLVTLKLVQEYYKAGKLNARISPKIFFIAMNACRRKHTEHAFMDAVSLLDMMRTLKLDMKPKILSSFIYTAILTGYAGCYKAAWKRLGPDHYNIAALAKPGGTERIFPSMIDYSEGAPDVESNVESVYKDTPKTHLQSQFDLLRNMVRLADFMLDPKAEPQLNEKEYDDVMSKRSKYNTLLTNYFNKDGISDGLSVGDPKFMKQAKLGKFEEPHTRRITVGGGDGRTWLSQKSKEEFAKRRSALPRNKDGYADKKLPKRVMELRNFSRRN